MVSRHIMTCARLLRPAPELDFHDRRSVTLPAAITPIEAWRIITAGHGPVMGAAFRLRDATASLFGARRIGGFSGLPRGPVQVGDRLDFFTVEHNAPDMLVLTNRDRHLDVMVCVTAQGTRLTVVASVVTHNWRGRMYMIPVAPAHRLIVAASLRRLRRHLRAAGR